MQHRTWFDDVLGLLPPELLSLYLSSGETVDGCYYLLARWRVEDARPEDAVRVLVNSFPDFAGVRAVQYLAYPDDEDPHGFGECWEEEIGDDDWAAGVPLDDIQLRHLREFGRVRVAFRPSGRCLARSEEGLNRDFVYATREDALADRIDCFPRLALLSELASGGGQADIASAVLAGHDDLLPVLVEAMRASRDPRTDQVASWILA